MPTRKIHDQPDYYEDYMWKKKKERGQLIFFKRVCVLLRKDADPLNNLSESLRLNGIQTSFVEWNRFKELIKEDVVAILYKPEVSQTELEQVLLEREKEKEHNSGMKLIVLSDEPAWKGYHVNYQLHVLAADTQIDEIKRQYFQLSSYLSNKSGFFKNLLKPGI